MNLAQIVQSHALSFFYLVRARPAARHGRRPGQAQCLRPDARPTRRSPATASACASSASRSSSRSAASASIPAWVVPGGVSEPLTAEKRDRILAAFPDALAIAGARARWFKRVMERFREEVRTFGNFPSLFMGLVDDDGGFEHYDGQLRFVDADGHDRRGWHRPARLCHAHRRDRSSPGAT